MSLGDLVVKLSADTAAFQADMGRAVHIAQRNSNQIKQAISNAKEGFEEISGSVKRFAGALAAFFVVNEAIKRTADMERTANRLNATLKATGYAAGQTAENINAMSDELKSTTAFDDDDIKKGISALLRFRQVQGDVFTDAVKLGVDLAASTDTDLVSAYTKLGRALTDPVAGLKGLREAGVKLSEVQVENVKRLVAFGDAAGAQRIVLDELKKSVGGSAGAENTGLYGSMKALGKAWDDLLKAQGANKASVSNSFIGFLVTSLKDLKEITESGDWIEKTLALLSFSVGFRGFESVTKGRPDQTSTEPARQIRGAEPLDRMSNAERAAVGALQARLERANEYAKTQAEKNEKASIDIKRAGADNEMQMAKQIADSQKQLAAAYYAQGVMGLQEYYDSRKSVIESSLDAELRAIREKQSIEANEFKKAGEDNDIERMGKARAALTKLIGEDQRLRAKKNTELAALFIEAGAAVDKFREKVSSLKEQLLTLQGDSIGASKLSIENKFEEDIRQLRANLNSGNPEVKQLATEGLAAVEKIKTITVGDAIEKFNDKLSELRAQVLELEGDITGAERLRLGIQNRGIKKELDIQAQGQNPELANAARQGLNDISTAERLIGARNDLSEAEKQAGLITQKLQLDEERLQNSLRTGAVSEFEAMMRTGELRKKAAADLEKYAEAMEAAAKANPANPEFLLRAEQARLAIEKLRLESDLLADKFDTIFKDGFSSAFSEFISGTKSMKDAFNDAAKSIVRNINDMISKNLAQELFGSISGKTGGTTPGSFLAGLFGGSAGQTDVAGGFGGVGSNEGGGFLAGIGSLLSGLLSFDVGTPYVPRDMIAKIHEGERIIPAAENRSGAWNREPSTPITVNMYGVEDYKSFKRVQGVFESDLYAAGQRASGRFK